MLSSSGTKRKMSARAIPFFVCRSSAPAISAGISTSRPPPSSLNVIPFCSLFSRIAPAFSSADWRWAVTVPSNVRVLPACLWLKSTCTLPDPTNLMTPLRPSTSTLSPASAVSASSPSLRSGIMRTFFLSRAPNPLSGSMSTVIDSPTDAPASASPNPESTGYERPPIETRRGPCPASPSGRCSRATSPRVVSNTSPVSFTRAV